jgi:hypothetical protein
MSKFNRFSVLTRNVIALMAVSGAGVAWMGAQAPAPRAAAAETPAQMNFQIPAMDISSTSLFSSSADEDAAAPATVASLHPTVANFAEAMQYGGGQRKRYGRPRYRGANTNADGSSKYIFYGGVGLAQPTGNTYHYLTPSWGVQVGGGRQFNKHFAVPVEFNYDHFGFAGETISNQIAVYDYLYGTGSVDGILDGSSHVWSFSVDPTYNVYSSDTWGAYVDAGVGFYHKTATFTVPSEQEYCDPYYGCYTYAANQPIDSYTSNAPGFSGGLGLTYKFSRFANERFYAEARYVFVDNSQRQGITAQTTADTTATSTNFYPANSNRTTYIPIKVGIRF